MVNIVTGEGAVFYWATEASFGNAGVGMPITATATHQPFNPIEGTINLPVPYYEQELIYLQNDLDPDADFIYDSEYIDAKGQFPNSNGMIYHDPFLMLELMFTRKTATGTWGGGAMKAEVSTIVAGAPGTIDDGDYITIQGIDAANTTTDYYIWFDKAGDESGDPEVADHTEILVDISGASDVQDVSDAIAAAITALANFGAVNGATTTTTITNAYKGNVTDIADVDSGLTVATTVQGISGGKLTGDFVTNAHESTVMFQYKTVDKDTTTIEDKSILGIKSEEFRIGFKNKGLLRTWYNLITMNETDNSRDYSAVAAFDDGKWAEWAKSTFYRASDCKIYWDDSFVAELTDIKIEDCFFIIKTPQAYLKTGDSLKAQYRHNKHRAYQAEITGLVLGDTELDEFRAAYASKTKKNLRLSWDQTANEYKFLDIDDAFIRGMKESKITGAAEVYKVTLYFEGISSDFEGTYNNLTDPAGRVTIA